MQQNPNPTHARSRPPVPHILLVDDNPVNTMVLSGLLGEEKYKFVCVENGAEAVDKYTHENFDLVFMDVNMPIMDGLEATRRIRQLEQNSDSAHTPIVAVTAYADREAQKKCEHAGMDDFLGKPVTSKLLREVVEKWLL